ncbi:MAG: hypothetical protein MOB07_16135 [Acidobacteria bacterium]|nr:hypothetical protein [Acidobacteriota bacterium]
MKRYIIRNVLVARLAALALSALFFLQPHAHAHAQGMIQVIVIFPSVGLAPGESLRLTLFNRDGAPLRVQAQIHNAGGILVGLADGSVRAGAFDTFEFKRSDIHLPGEERTGRIQLSPSFDIRMSGPGKKIDGLAVSMETISISDGTSNTVFVGEIPPSQGRGIDDFIVDTIDRGTFLIGFVPGQTLRVTFTNPNPINPNPMNLTTPGSDAQRKPVSGHVKVFDGSGNLIAQSAELVIPSGESRSFGINHDALPILGEPGTNRKQVRIKPFFNFKSERLSRVLTSFEIVDNSTGKTTVLAGQQCLVFFLGGIPGN